jgi:hypothetical protein
MKRSTMNLMLAAAALLVASTVSSAQTTLSAEIPFSFHAAGTLMPAGSYRLVPSDGESRFYVSNSEGKGSILLVSRIVADAPKDWVSGRTPKLQFRCGNDGCALERIWTGKAAAGAHLFLAPNRKQGGQLGFIRVVSAKAR